MKTQNTAARPRGRPPTDKAGQIDELILEAATAIFLERGFIRTSMDQVAASSRTGKTTLYARYASKKDLFSAVVQRSIAMMFDDLEPLPDGISQAERLRHTGKELLRSLLHPRCVALMRITAAETANFPELAAMAYQVSLEGCVRCINAALSPCQYPQPETVGKRFVELVLQPAAFKALYGADAQVLLNRCQADISDALTILFPDSSPDPV